MPRRGSAPKLPEWAEVRSLLSDIREEIIEHDEREDDFGFSVEITVDRDHIERAHAREMDDHHWVIGFERLDSGDRYRAKIADKVRTNVAELTKEEFAELFAVRGSDASKRVVGTGENKVSVRDLERGEFPEFRIGPDALCVGPRFFDAVREWAEILDGTYHLLERNMP